MTIIQTAYKLIYNEKVNFVLRNINKFLLPVLPYKIKISPAGILKVKNKDGRIIKIKTNQTNYLTRLIFWEGGYARFEYTDIFIRLIKKVRSFYDIGANIGYYSLIAAMENADVEVVGFEPATGPLYYFRENVRINNFKNIKIESIALSDKDGEIEFYEIRNKKYQYLEHNLAGEGNAGSNKTGRNFVRIKVKASTLDNYVLMNNVSGIDLIKMDTEGTENLILEKSGYVLKEMKPVIICETLFDTIESELERIMKSFGYDFYNHTEAGLQKTDSIVRKVNNGISNCFFVHPSKFYLIKEFVI
jgi:FkbM family methyltransferase